MKRPIAILKALAQDTDLPQEKIKIFLSAVTGQFKTCRNALRSDLSAVGAEVIVQDDFQQGGGTLLEKLEQTSV